jgi:hypothetical protein
VLLDFAERDISGFRWFLVLVPSVAWWPSAKTTPVELLTVLTQRRRSGL